MQSHSKSQLTCGVCVCADDTYYLKVAKIDTIEQRYEIRGVLWVDWEATPEDIENRKEDPQGWTPSWSPDVGMQSLRRRHNIVTHCIIYT